MRKTALSAAIALTLATMPAGAQTRPSDPPLPPPAAKDWAALANLPDWSGTWTPVISDQDAQVRTNPTPWKPDIQKQVDFWNAEEEAGRPNGLLLNCLPHGMPSFMLITHNAIEVLPTPGRITILGESDGNRIRRIWTDGRAMPDDPDPSFHGYSVGHWEGETLVVHTKAILPQVYIAVSEAVGIPNGGDMVIDERIHLIDPNMLAFDMTITAPHVLTKPWQTRRLFRRDRRRSTEIVEGVCRQGDFLEDKDKWGNPIFVPATQDNGNVLPPGK
jgi:hypothetical protein